MFDDPGRYLWLIPVLPLAASALTTFLGPGLLRQKSHWPCVIAAALSCVLSFCVLIAVLRGNGGVWNYGPWFRAGDVDVTFSLGADGLSAIMLVTVTFVGTLIAIFSIGYMHGDEGYARFFAEIALFLFSMTGLVLANNYILLYGFWEGVGVCSYLLIGHYYQRPSAAAAGRKAFLVTRLGDVGMFLGILLLWNHFGSLNYSDLFTQAAVTPDRGVVVLACLLLFCGAVGKSAQFPLHVWLPDAMEGPTPVSALIHAATMVTAGVYLVARSTPLFVRAPEVQLLVACIGGFTALLAALMAITQTDLKRVLAYSTISQLGFMFLALGSGLRGAHVVTLAVTAAIFHLVTHAFFKALLFLSSGSVMHAMGGIIDMRRFSGLRKVLPVTHWTFLCGAAALSGVPIITSGFWSKDDILAADFGAGTHGGPYSGVYVLLFIVALFTAGLTAFYTFRAYFLTFWGQTRLPPEAEHHAHESPPVMTVPLIILAVGAIGLGIILGPTGWFEGFLHEYWLNLGTVQRAVSGDEEGPSLNIVLMLLSSLVALGGIVIAWWMYVRQPALPGEIVQHAPAAYQLSRNRFYLDEIYTALVVMPLAAGAAFCRAFDLYFVDGVVDTVGQTPAWLGKVVSPIQNGLTQFYALLMVLGLTGFLLAVLLR
jgi:proton-translocating NADH-quinone oxidoreductase chain L